jgi:site-specific DNA-methyltransferase (adenine-specific)
MVPDSGSVYRLRENFPQRPRQRRQHLRRLGMTDSGVAIFEFVLRSTVHGLEHRPTASLAVNHIASECGLDRTTVIKHMKRLRDAGLIETVQDAEWWRHKESQVGIAKALLEKVRSSGRSAPSSTRSSVLRFGLHHGDCFEGLPRIAARSVQLLLTDLPTGETENDWDVPLDLDAFWHQVRRVLKPNGAAVIFAHFPYDKRLAMSNINALKHEYIWQKPAVNFFNAKYEPLRAHEAILVFAENTPLYNPQIAPGGEPYRTKRKPTTSTNYGGSRRATVTVSSGSRYPTSVLAFPRDRDNSHSTGKPTALLETMIRSYSNPGDLVCDPCAGGGAVFIAAANTQRLCVGWEKNGVIYEKAAQRIREHARTLANNAKTGA